jgi:ParB family chromosome partitioning protein
MSNDPKRRALGRGLESLLPARPAAAAPAEPAQAPQADGKAFEIAVDRIDRNPFQTRTTFDERKLAELALSIEASGVVQPIVVREAKDGRYTLITGERRLLASRKAGLATIPAVVREVSDVQAMEMTIVENLQRENLNPMEQARAYQRLSHEFKMTQEQMAQRTGKERASVTNFLRLLRLPEAMQEAVEGGELSFGHARALLALESHDAMQTAAARVVAQHMSVRATEQYVQGLLNPERRNQVPKTAPLPVDPNVREAQDQLRRSLGLKVTIEDKKGKGRVVIEYSGIDDFDAILSALGNAGPGNAGHGNDRHGSDTPAESTSSRGSND